MTHHEAIQLTLLLSTMLCMFGLTLYEGIPQGASLLFAVGMMSALMLVIAVRGENE